MLFTIERKSYSLLPANDIANGIVHADVICGRTEFPAKEVITQRNTTANLTGSFPNNLSKMVERRLTRIICSK